MKFGQLLKYDRNISLQKSYAKCGGETSFRSFYKKNKIEHVSGSLVWNVITGCLVDPENPDVLNLI